MYIEVYKTNEPAKCKKIEWNEEQRDTEEECIKDASNVCNQISIYV